MSLCADKTAAFQPGRDPVAVDMADKIAKNKVQEAPDGPVGL